MPDEARTKEGLLGACPQGGAVRSNSEGLTSQGVSTGPITDACQTKRFSSDSGDAEHPSGGSTCGTNTGSARQQSGSAGCQGGREAAKKNRKQRRSAASTALRAGPVPPPGAAWCTGRSHSHTP